MNDVRNFVFLIGLLLTVQSRADISYGSGFFVSTDGYFITNYHVIDGATEVAVESGGDKHKAKVVREDPTNDLAILKVDGVHDAIEVVSASNVSLGESVFTIGFPNPTLQGTTPKFTKGEISARTGIRDDARFFQISVPVQPGNSGGMLVTERGKVVGVVTLKLDDINTLKTSGSLPQNVNYALKSDYLLGLIDAVRPANRARMKGSADTKDQAAAIAVAEKAAGMVVAQLPSAAPNTTTATDTPNPGGNGIDQDPISQVKAFVKLHVRSGNTNTELSQLDFYAPRVDYFENGLVDTQFIRQDLKKYHKRWGNYRSYDVEQVYVSQISQDTFVAACTIGFNVSGVPGERSGLVTNQYTIRTNENGARITKVKSKAWKNARTTKNRDGYSNLRSSPTTKQSNVITRVPMGSQVLVLPEKDGWWLTLTGSGELGYMHKTQFRTQ